MIRTETEKGFWLQGGHIFGVEYTCTPGSLEYIRVVSYAVEYPDQNVCITNVPKSEKEDVRAFLVHIMYEKIMRLIEKRIGNDSTT